MSRDAEITDYLLGEMAAEDRGRLEARMARDPGLRAEVERMRAVVAGLEALPAEAWAPGPVPPPPALPAAAPARPARGVRPLVAVAAAVAALAVGVGVGALVTGGGDGDEPGDGPAIALDRFGDAAPGAHGEVRMTGGDAGMRLAVSGLRPSGDGFYELWLLGDDGRMVSLGAFRVPPSGATEVSVPLPADPSSFSYIDVSLEPPDGDPAHSGASVLRGATPSA
ncbi:anti-sigma factor [Miltoncostaea marina]|uniref:anti-sigma factor n=1 Tax=Miltoncostaea marina TaxID=2843215 RepID=UPI001C3E4A8D|nr:anti-sigma factor [Miltoncostaea marina]